MATSDAATPEEYLAGLGEERRAVLAEVRRTILDNLPEGYEEGMDFGMIGYHVPLERYPETYNGRPLGYVALAAQKNHNALYLMGVYGPEQDEFREEWRATGKRLDMGKACVRFKRLDDVPLDVVGRWVARWPVEEFIARHERLRARGGAGA
ncbi:DUF1801 domain-containing protein [Nocardiopsis suaedae]|uniref:DUF1801 domain-containing protein n=1 Tax=Nocardiopsis suaedae TaxID=3018444 RepID=A0ABT4TG41_9ACTN|nr:DUF1801 domain-containing protein [Nocardiopsis suaedae]MDA2803673.1 DUF1801 domain-containing protein [Nocardiopsis suaedae]